MTELEKILQKAAQEENNGEFFAAHHSYKAALEIARKANDSVKKMIFYCAPGWIRTTVG